MFALADVTAFADEILRYNPFERPHTSEFKRGKPGATTGATTMELRGTVVDGPDSLANIDGDYYRLNHEISGYRVVRIENGSVTLSRGDNEMVLTLRDDE